MAKATAILNGTGGELDRVTFEYSGDNFTLDDVNEAVRKENHSFWTLGDGDTITIFAS